MEFFFDPYDVAVRAEGLILATDWSEYGILDLKRLAESMVIPVLLGARNMLNRGKAEKTGFFYIGGRKAWIKK